MELSTVLQSCCSLQLRFPITIRPSSSRSPPQIACLKFSNKGCNLLGKQARWLQSSPTNADVGDKSAVRHDFVCQGLSSSHTSEAASVHDEPKKSSEERDDGDSDGARCLDDSRMVRVCDKLIDVFIVDKPTPTDWRRLLAFSKEWNNIRPHFFARCQDRADDEKDPVMKQKLLRLGRKLKEIDEDVQRHNELLQVIRESSTEITEIISRRRKDFTKEFFVHLHTVAESYYDNPKEQNELAKLANACLAAVQAYDAATDSMEALNAAELKFQDIINSPSLDAACKKIDTLAEKKELDSALVLMITKAWSAAKESNMMKDEVKDVLYHLYKTAVGNLQRLVPKEIRIIKHVIRIEDPEELMCALRDAFTPGEELEGTDEDTLYTTPEKLHTWIKVVVDAYNLSGEGTLIREARDLLNPKVIQKLEELKKVVEGNFM
ncbi:uncharacterized protein At4g37920 isoform X1 [Prosopis cineraria]|uniref:uncharacterized protein At4g37920 isoform X1 n=1 Tax=Prosopis cineraria TaxID=364024 RepID=UPI00240FA590|nr:uncharacterized protein At4g37920 isoform X1 [Prosopis cineraria]XP_054798595.1 uncharacterized protein At4g37920 isoform X1 [Prosopis cineraria]XP_054798596.1 uncharacterized protein At4g37920 isoform X1 [Prosopis cineraria]